MARPPPAGHRHHEPRPARASFGAPGTGQPPDRHRPVRAPSSRIASRGEHMRRIIFSLALIAMSSPAWAQQDWITTFIGGGPNDIPATQSDVYYPVAVAVDSAGNYYIAACDAN